MVRYRCLILVLALLLILPACTKKEAVPIVEEIEKPSEEPPPPLEEIEEPAEEPVEVEEEEIIVLKDIFFDFDKFNIKDEYKGILSENAAILVAHPGVKLLIEGHCDERGTNEYNLALGEKRAKAVFDFYAAYGVGVKSISTISYGEERPFDPGSNESAWAKNRRVHMVVQ
jgi:peptidoglycan-associated lipoprotein